MTRHIVLPACVALWMCCIASVPCTGANVPSHDEIMDLLKAERFDDLDKIAAELRAEKVQFYRGYSALSQFYGRLALGRRANDDSWTAYLKRLKHWAGTRPQSPTPLIALGNAYISYAWKARGSGWADSVTDEGWRLFEVRLKQAREFLQRAEVMPAKDPEVYRALLVVARGEGWPREEMEAVFKKGVELEPNYQQLYESKAGYLLPRWNGEPGDWEDFAQEAGDARGGDEGDILYMIIARSQAWTEKTDLFENTTFSYDRIKKGFEASLRRSPESLWEINSFCYFACCARDQDTAKELFTKISHRWAQDVWGQHTVFEQWQNWALNGAAAPQSASPRSRGQPLVTPEKMKSIALVGGLIWLGLVAVIGGAIILLVHRHKNS